MAPHFLRYKGKNGKVDRRDRDGERQRESEGEGEKERRERERENDTNELLVFMYNL